MYNNNSVVFRGKLLRVQKAETTFRYKHHSTTQQIRLKTFQSSRGSQKYYLTLEKKNITTNLTYMSDYTLCRQKTLYITFLKTKKKTFHPADPDRSRRTVKNTRHS